MEPPRENDASPSAGRRPTMRDVARLAGGVHPSTVSLVLRNSPNISEETRKRVLAAVRKAGYRRDPLLDAYNLHRTGLLPHKSEPIIAWVSELTGREQLESEDPFAQYWAGARRAAANLHCRLEPFFIGQQRLGPERLDSILQARGISALVLMALSARFAPLPFDWKEYSAVRIESPRHALPALAIASDHRNNLRLAMQSLRRQGLCRIGLALDSSKSLVDLDYLLSGFYLEQAGLSPEAKVGYFDLAGGGLSPRLREWLREQRPDVVLVEHALQGALLQEQVPGLRLISLSLSSSAPSGVAGLCPDLERVGEQAVEQLVGLMRANQRGAGPASSTTYVPGAWRAASEA